MYSNTLQYLKKIPTECVCISNKYQTQFQLLTLQMCEAGMANISEFS